MSVRRRRTRRPTFTKGTRRSRMRPSSSRERVSLRSATKMDEVGGGGRRVLDQAICTLRH